MVVTIKNREVIQELWKLYSHYHLSSPWCSCSRNEY